ncbi:MAG: hypothetical protein JNL32_00900 [Candidatus Kapabacteria bacterium]|nr:hypothetical protein [Candidatus Kapabacteria bacterium]
MSPKAVHIEHISFALGQDSRERWIRFAAILTFITMLVHVHTSLIVWSWYWLDNGRTATQYCVNTESDCCKGKCYVTTALEKSEDGSNSTTPSQAGQKPTQKNEREVPYIKQPYSFFIATLYYSPSRMYDIYKGELLHGYTHIPTKPPESCS